MLSCGETLLDLLRAPAATRQSYGPSYAAVTTLVSAAQHSANLLTEDAAYATSIVATLLDSGADTGCLLTRPASAAVKREITGPKGFGCGRQVAPDTCIMAFLQMGALTDSPPPPNPLRGLSSRPSPRSPLLPVPVDCRGGQPGWQQARAGLSEEALPARVRQAPRAFPLRDPCPLSRLDTAPAAAPASVAIRAAA